MLVRITQLVNSVLQDEAEGEKPLTEQDIIDLIGGWRLISPGFRLNGSGV
jgi:hypothetical protein